MPEGAAPGFVQDGIPERLVTPDRLAHVPQGIARRRRDTADNDIADLAFGMSRADVDGLGTAHEDLRRGKVRGLAGKGKRDQTVRAVRQGRSAGVFPGLRAEARSTPV
jgi:hypothetical protein